MTENEIGAIFIVICAFLSFAIFAHKTLGPDGRKELKKDIKDRLCFWRKKDKERKA